MNKNNWYGTLTIDNIQEVADAILEKLSGKTYAFVSAYEYRRYEPETRLNQRLHNGTNGSPLSVYYGENGDYAGFNFCDTYGVWGCSTNTNQKNWDSSYNNPYIVFDYDQITITQRTPAGKLAYWQITID